MTAPLLTEDVVRFMLSGVSISVASRDVRRVPSLARAAGCRVNAGEVTVLLLPAQARQLLADISASGMVAVVFSSPSTNRTLQIKGRLQYIQAASSDDVAAAVQHREAFAEGIIPLGYAHDLAYAVHCRDNVDLMAVRFAPTDVFEQTPGPKAGTRLAQ
ncbi:MAG TPA: hypothetical protein VF050_12945 [Moraxellaceae bacterium]